MSITQLKTRRSPLKVSQWRRTRRTKFLWRMRSKMPLCFPRYKFLSFTSLSLPLKVKDSGHNFREENTVHSLPKIAPALQAECIGTFIGSIFIMANFSTTSTYMVEDMQMFLGIVLIINQIFSRIRICSPCWCIFKD